MEKRIANFLAKYDRNQLLELRLKERISELIKNKTNTIIKTKDITLSPEVIFIKTDPKTKTKIKLLNNYFLTTLKDEFKKLSFKKII